MSSLFLVVIMLEVNQELTGEVGEVHGPFLGKPRELAWRLLYEGLGQFSVAPSSRVTVANDDVNCAECSGTESEKVLPQVYYPVAFIHVAVPACPSFRRRSGNGFSGVGITHVLV